MNYTKILDSVPVLSSFILDIEAFPSPLYSSFVENFWLHGLGKICISQSRVLLVALPNMKFSSWVKKGRQGKTVKVQIGF